MLGGSPRLAPALDDQACDEQHEERVARKRAAAEPVRKMVLDLDHHMEKHVRENTVLTYFVVFALSVLQVLPPIAVYCHTEYSHFQPL